MQSLSAHQLEQNYLIFSPPASSFVLVGRQVRSLRRVPGVGAEVLDGEHLRVGGQEGPPAEAPPAAPPCSGAHTPHNTITLAKVQGERNCNLMVCVVRGTQ